MITRMMTVMIMAMIVDDDNLDNDHQDIYHDYDDIKLGEACGVKMMVMVMVVIIMRTTRMTMMSNLVRLVG